MLCNKISFYIWINSYNKTLPKDKTMAALNCINIQIKTSDLQQQKAELEHMTSACSVYDFLECPLDCNWHWPILHTNNPEL